MNTMITNYNNYIAVTVALGMIVVAVALSWLLLRTGQGYPPSKVDAEETHYAGIVGEAGGPINAFLWIQFLFFAVWLVVYLVQHRAEFAILFYH